MNKSRIFFISIIVLLAVLAVFYFIKSGKSEKAEKVDNIESLVTREDASKVDTNIIPEGVTGFEVDVSKSKINWSGSKIIGDPLTGTVGILTGSFFTKDDNIVGGKFIVDMEDIISTNLESDEAKKSLVTHLKGDDFFKVEEYPTATLLITSISEKESENGNYEITGDFTILDKVNPVTFPATIAYNENKITAQAEFEIDRTSWGIEYGSDKFFKNLGDNVIKDEIGFEIYLEAVLE